MFQRHSFARAIAALSCLSFGSAATAADAAPPPSDAPVELETIIVEASPLGGSADELVHPADVLAGDELERKRRGTLGEALENELGVSSSDFGPGVGRPMIRGQGGARVAVLENGIGAMDVSTVSNDHAVSIDPGTAEQVEIIKGPATLIYGSAASAGVVNVVNSRLPDEVTPGFSGSADLNYAGNADERNGKLDLNYGFGGTQLHADYAGRKTGLFEIPGNAFADGSAPVDGEIPNSAVETQSGALSVSRIGEAGSVGLAVSRYEDTYGIPKEEAAYIDLEQTRVDFEGRLAAPLEALESLKLRVGSNDYTHTEFEGPGEPGTRFDNDEIEARLEAVHAPLAGWRGVLGTQLIDRDFSALGEEAFVPAVKTRSLGLFLVEQRSFGPARLELGTRVERQQQRPTAPGVADLDHTPLSFSAGLIYDLDEHHHLRLTATRAQRAPAAEELYALGPHLATGTYERGNAGLEEETSSNLEIGIDRHQGRWTWQASVYYNQIEDYVFLQEADDDGDGVADLVDPEGAPFVEGESEEGPLLLVDYHQGDARFWGYEAETGYAFLQGPVKLSGRLFTDAVRAELDSGEALPRITPARYGAGLRGGWQKFSGGIDFTRVDQQDEVAPLETATGGYNLLSADFSYRLEDRDTRRSSLYLRGRNLLDEEGRRHTSFLKDVAPIAGATLLVGVNVTFF